MSNVTTFRSSQCCRSLVSLLALSFLLLAAAIAPAQDSTTSVPAPNRTLSRQFAPLALQAAAEIRNWQMHFAFTFKNGYPLSDFWIAYDRNRAADALALATLAAQREADRAALVQLDTLFVNVQAWSDARVEDNRNLRLANYYMSPSSLDNDEPFQRTVRCTDSLISKLVSGEWAEETICR